MSKLWLMQGFFCQGASEYGIGFAPIEGTVATVRRKVMPVAFWGAFWHAGLMENNPVVGRMSDEFGHSELNKIEYVEGEELVFSKCYFQTSGTPVPLNEVFYRFTKEAGSLWYSGEYVIDSNKPFKGPARCIVTEVTLDPIEADLDKFAKDHGFQDPQRVER